MVARNPVSARIECRFAVREKLVMVMSVTERNLDLPSAIGSAFHRVRLWVPIVKIADQMHLTGVRSRKGKSDGLNHLFGGIPIRRDSETRAIRQVRLIWRELHGGIQLH